MKAKSILALTLIGIYSAMSPQVDRPSGKKPAKPVPAFSPPDKSSKQEPTKPIPISLVANEPPKKEEPAPIIPNSYHVNRFDKPGVPPLDYRDPKILMPLENFGIPIQQLKGVHLLDEDNDEKLSIEEWLDYLNILFDGRIDSPAYNRLVFMPAFFVPWYKPGDILSVNPHEHRNNIEDTVENLFKILKEVNSPFYDKRDAGKNVVLREGNISRKEIHGFLMKMAKEENLPVVKEEIEQEIKDARIRLGSGFEFKDEQLTAGAKAVIMRAKAVKFFMSLDKDSKWVKELWALKKKSK